MITAIAIAIATSELSFTDTIAMHVPDLIRTRAVGGGTLRLK